MQRRTKETLVFFEFRHLMHFPEIFHAVFTRIGGKSHAPFDSLNVACNVGDNPEHVRYNRQCVLNCAHGGKLIDIRQVHGKQVVILKKSHCGKKRIDSISEMSGDALITDIPGMMLLIQVADCQSIMMFDPQKKVVANIHSGWKGSVQNIIRATIISLQTEFGSNPRDIIAGIGPSLGPCCAEFINFREELPKPFWSYKDERNRFNFWEISRRQMIQTGVLPDNIRVSQICTRCRTDLFFSYRAEQRTGRIAAVIGLN